MQQNLIIWKNSGNNNYSIPRKYIKDFTQKYTYKYEKNNFLNKANIYKYIVTEQIKEIQIITYGKNKTKNNDYKIINLVEFDINKIDDFIYQAEFLFKK